jgi:hypothetical protein
VLDQSSAKGCTTVTLGCWLIALGIVWMAVTFLLRPPPLIRTIGVVIESRPQSFGVTRRAIKYEYLVNGVRYNGERFLWTSSVYPKMYDVGEPFAVYFNPNHPEVSYGPTPPNFQTRVIIGVMYAAFGVVALFWRPGST